LLSPADDNYFCRFAMAVLTTCTRVASTIETVLLPYLEALR
jgi:hypothetical protein